MAPRVLLLLLGVAVLVAVAEAQACSGVTETDRVAAGCGAAAGPGVFEELSLSELLAVNDFLNADPTLNLTRGDVATPSDNYIYSVATHLPTKAQAVAFLDAGGAKPPRRAIVMLHMGGRGTAQVWNVIVTLGSPPTWVRTPIGANQAVNAVPYNLRAHSSVDDTPLFYLIDATFTALDPVISAITGGWTYSGCDAKCLSYSYTIPMTSQRPSGTHRYIWTYYQRALEGYFDHDITVVQTLLELDGTDGATWRVAGVWYAGTPNTLYPTVDAFLAAWAATIPRVSIASPSDADAIFSTFQQRPGPNRGDPTRPLGAINVSPYGDRFTITRQKVDWMGWSLNVGVHPAFGMRFHDIKFRGERVAYEISMQEAIAGYSGFNPGQTSSVWLDSQWSLGNGVRELVHGLDCPPTASYMDVYTQLYGWRPVRARNAICVFEKDLATPQMRHFSTYGTGSYDFVAGVTGSVLVIRSVAVTYNYNYIVDLILHLDGAIEGKVEMTGYVQSVTAISGTEGDTGKRFGYPMWLNTTGTYHDHMMHWKVDVDIAGGSANSVLLHSTDSETFTDLFGNTRRRKFLSASLAANEAAYAASATPHLLAVVAEGARNSWGSMRGYALHMVTKETSLLSTDDPAWPIASWATTPVAFTVFKEAERHSSSQCYTYWPGSSVAPPTQFSTFVNNEPARNKDIVLWVAPGVNHVPSAEDAPVTPLSGARQASWALRPFNLLDSNGATDLAYPLMWRFVPDDDSATRKLAKGRARTKGKQKPTKSAQQVAAPGQMYAACQAWPGNGGAGCGTILSNLGVSSVPFNGTYDYYF